MTGDYQRDLYNCHGKGENERAERFSGPVRHYLSMVDGGENGGNQDHARHGRRGTGRAEDHGHDHNREGQSGPRPRPPRS
jgi:hypothetical protein